MKNRNRSVLLNLSFRRTVLSLLHPPIPYNLNVIGPSGGGPSSRFVVAILEPLFLNDCGFCKLKV